MFTNVFPNDKDENQLMKLSTRSRYGTRLMLDMAQHHDQGPIQLADIARRQELPQKYLEQIIIPLRKARLVGSVRGSRGGHYLAKSPSEITVGEIVRLLEGKQTMMQCTDHPEVCTRSDQCLTRQLWKEAMDAMFEKLNSITLQDLVERGRMAERENGGASKTGVVGNEKARGSSPLAEPAQDGTEAHEPKRSHKK